MYRYANYKGYSKEGAANLGSFADGFTVSEYAKEAMAWAVGNGIITGKQEGRLLDPFGSATRAESAAIIYRFMESCAK